jgi:hypothetical protein
MFLGATLKALKAKAENPGKTPFFLLGEAIAREHQKGILLSYRNCFSFVNRCNS